MRENINISRKKFLVFSGLVSASVLIFKNIKLPFMGNNKSSLPKVESNKFAVKREIRGQKNA